MTSTIRLGLHNLKVNTHRVTLLTEGTLCGWSRIPSGPRKKNEYDLDKSFHRIVTVALYSVPIKSLENNVNLINTKYFLPHQQNVHVQTLCNHSQFGYTFIYWYVHVIATIYTMYYTCIMHEKSKTKGPFATSLTWITDSCIFKQFPYIPGYFYVTLRTPLTAGVLVWEFQF